MGIIGVPLYKFDISPTPLCGYGRKPRILYINQVM